MGLEQPALAAVADYLLEQFQRDREADLSDAIVVVPGGRAGRRLLEILVDLCEASGAIFTPPDIVTVGRLPEVLYQAKRPFADDLVQQLTWAQTLKGFDREKLQQVIAQPPEEDESERWYELGRMLQLLHRELASDGLDFNDVVKRGSKLPGFAEAGRWLALAEIQRAYLNTLDGLGLWDRQTARLFAIQHRECDMDRPVILVAAVDLNQSMRQMLDQVAGRVTALVYAPETWRERFDSHGCLIPERWESVELQIPDSSLISAADPADQAEAAARHIAGFEARYRAEQITIGLPDARIVAQLIRQLDECKLPNRYGPGCPLSRTGVFRMFEDLAALLQGRRYADFAQLVRHSDIEAWLMRSGVQPGWLEELDEYYNEHLPRRIDGQWLGDREDFPRLCEAHERIARLAGRLQGAPQPLDQWLPQISRIVLDVYGNRDFDLEAEADRQDWKACNAVQDALGQWAGIPASVMPNVKGSEALRLLLDCLSAQSVAPPASEAAIELVGWLELPLDDAPAMIVTSFNEGFVPSSINADLFLPGGLRSALGLDDNARRYARDAYAVATLLAPWRETTFIVARRNADDDPLSPSRLLFAAAPETVAERSLRFFDEAPKRPPQQPLAGGLMSARTESAFEVPRPLPLPEPIRRMSVTSFKSYLACPYRFYLSRVLRLSRTDDDATELDGASFGDLAHSVLEQFGRSEVRDAPDKKTIEHELNHLLNQLVQQRFGEHPSAALLVQIEQLRLRLAAFANWQADWVSQGWRIEHAEFAFSESSQTLGKLDVDGEPMLLSGRIDRIDFNEQSGKRMVLDYKTSDAGDSPEKTHRKSGEWIDLQLPLYRHLVRELGIDGPIELGYILLPKSISKVGLSPADWTEAELEKADHTARDIVRNVRQQKFWPPTEPPPAYSEDFAGICMDGVFGKKNNIVNDINE